VVPDLKPELQGKASLTFGGFDYQTKSKCSGRWSRIGIMVNKTGLSLMVSGMKDGKYLLEHYEIRNGSGKICPLANHAFDSKRWKISTSMMSWKKSSRRQRMLMFLPSPSRGAIILEKRRKWCMFDFEYISHDTFSAQPNLGIKRLEVIYVERTGGDIIK
jgi:hypothetical protein